MPSHHDDHLPETADLRVSLDVGLVAEIDQAAARDGRSRDELIEEALRVWLGDAASLRPLITFGGSGVRPGVDLSDLRSIVERDDQDRMKR